MNLEGDLIIGRTPTFGGWSVKHLSYVLVGKMRDCVPSAGLPGTRFKFAGGRGDSPLAMRSAFLSTGVGVAPTDMRTAKNAIMKVKFMVCGNRGR